jgi:hypothetical protein
MNVDVFAYSTGNYRRLVEIWRRSLVFPKWTLVEEQECDSVIESKIRSLLDFFVPNEEELVIVSDVDLVFFNSPSSWNKLFSEIMESSKKSIFFMRDAVKTSMNAGFYIVKREYFETKLKPFMRNMLLEGSWKTMKHCEQSYMNEHLPREDWDFIADEYTYMPFVEKNMSRVLFYHAICVPDKERALELALKTKRYQVHLCFHDGVEESVQNVLYRHPYMIPYRLGSTKYFESEFFMNVEIDTTAEYIGMVTYSILYKPHIFKTNILKILERATEDVITLHHIPTERIENTNKDHPKFLSIWNRLTERLGVSPECGDMFFCNYWLAKPEILQEYQKFLKRASEILEDDPDVYCDACYSVGKLSSERLCEITGGKPHYTYHPFVLERLPCLFVHLHNLTVHHVRYC